MGWVVQQCRCAIHCSTEDWRHAVRTRGGMTGRVKWPAVCLPTPFSISIMNKTINLRDLSVSTPWLVCQGPITTEEEDSATDLIDLPHSFYSNVTIGDWRDSSEFEILDGAAAVIQEHWRRYRERVKKQYGEQSSAFSVAFREAATRRQAALKIQRFWRALRARRSWRSDVMNVITIQRKIRVFLAKQVLAALKSARALHLQTIRQEVEPMRQNPSAWVANLDHMEFIANLERVQQRVAQRMKQSAENANKLITLVCSLSSRELLLIPPILGL